MSNYLPKNSDSAMRKDNSYRLRAFPLQPNQACITALTTIHSHFVEQKLQSLERLGDLNKDPEFLTSGVPLKF